MWKKIIFFFILLLIGMIAWFYIAAMRSPIGPPNPPFSFKETCTIQLDGKYNYVAFCSGKEYFIAQSSEDLKTYINKKVHITASYLRNPANTDALQTNLQCIKDHCKHLFTDPDQKVYAIVIEKIRVINTE